MSRRRSLIVVFLLGLGVILLLAATYLVPLLIQYRISTAQRNKPVKAIPTGEEFQQEPDASPDIVLKPFHRFITHQGQSEIEIEAELAEFNQAKKIYILKNITRAVLYGKDDRSYTLSADECTWDKAKDLLDIRGNVNVEMDAGTGEVLTATSHWMTYDFSREIMDGGGGVKLWMGPYYSEGDSLAINLKENRVILDGNVLSKIYPEALENASYKIDSPISIMARQIRYYHVISMVEYLGNPIIKSGSDRLICTRFRYEFGVNHLFQAFDGFELTLSRLPDESGPAAPRIVTGKELKVDLNAGEILINGNARAKEPNASLSADTIRLQLDNESSDLLSASAEGGVFFRREDLTAGSDHAIYNPVEDQLVMSGNAKITHKDENHLEAMLLRIYPNRRFYMADEHVTLTFTMPEKDNKQLLIQKDRPLPVDMPRSKDGPGMLPQLKTGVPVHVQANQAEMDDINGIIRLTGDVHGRQLDYRFGAQDVVLRFDPLSRDLMSMTAHNGVNLSQTGSMVTGDALRYNVDSGMFEMQGNATAWQDKNQMEANIFRYFPDQDVFEFEENVVVILAGKPDSSGTETPPIRITADLGRFNQALGLGKFTGNTKMTWQDWIIECDSVDLELDSATRELSAAVARGHVKVNRNEFNADGAQLTFNSRESIIILKGDETEKCKVWMGERGSQGDEVRYYIEEDRFEIDNGLSVVMPDQLSGTIP